MRLVIDLQGAQTGSRWRGIGRYTHDLVKKIATIADKNDIFIVLNDAFPETVMPIRRAFEMLLPRDNIRVWSALSSIVGDDLIAVQRRKHTEAIYECFLTSLNPDIILITSLFEGREDGFATTVKATEFNIPTAVICYDFIPLHDPERHLKPDPSWHKLYMERFERLGHADLLIAISDHSAHDAQMLLPDGEREIVNISAACSDVFQPSLMSDSKRAILFARLGIDKAYIVTSGGIDPHKNLSSLFQAFAALPIETRRSHQLVLVGNNEADQQKELLNQARAAGMAPNELIMTQYISDDDLVALYTDAKLMVFPSTDEGFGLPPLEAMSCGTPAIGSNVSSIPEVIGLDAALFDPYDIPQLSELIHRSLTENNFRAELINHAHHQAQKFSWEVTAKRALEAIETLHARSTPRNDHKHDDVLATCLTTIAQHVPQTADVTLLARHLAYNFPATKQRRRLFIDISTLRRHDARTGCQRVARSVLMEWLLNPPANVEVCPVYAEHDKATFFHAREYIAKLTEQSTDLIDLPIDYAQGDVFFGLDLHADIGELPVLFLEKMHRRGVRVLFLVYDLLPLEMPDYFEAPLCEAFKRWVQIITHFDGVIGISQASSNAVFDWERTNKISELNENFEYHAVHLGADIENSLPTTGMPKDASEVLAVLSKNTSFLMTGTLEPRKGQTHALDAFDELWADKHDVVLVIVGKEGWHVEDLAKRLRNHPELGKRLFWLEGVSDEYLEEIYKNATCLLAASWGEGFGLPLIEAARYNLPILARDLLVFREVAKDNAIYFDTTTAEGLAKKIASWKVANDIGKVPSSGDIPWLTWAESAEQMGKILLES